MRSAPSAAVGGVLFDFGGTLDADGLPWSERFHRAYRAHGGTLDADAFAAAFRASDVQLAHAPAIAHLGFREMLDAQAGLLAALLPDGRAVDLAAVAAAVQDDARRIAARNRRVLGALAGLPLGIVSNFTGNLERCLVELGLRDAFAVVLDSAVVGIAKPEPAIFARALERLGTSAAATLMVGDNPFADVRAAAAAGLRTCWLAPADRPAPAGVHPDLRLARLTELPAALGRAPAPDDVHGAACTV